MKNVFGMIVMGSALFGNLSFANTAIGEDHSKDLGSYSCIFREYSNGVQTARRYFSLVRQPSHHTQVEIKIGDARATASSTGSIERQGIAGTISTVDGMSAQAITYDSVGMLDVSLQVSPDKAYRLECCFVLQ